MLERPSGKELEEFVSATDDSADLTRLAEAEIVFVSISHVGKTVLSETFKNKFRIKASNVAVFPINGVPHISLNNNSWDIDNLKAMVKRGRPFVVGLDCSVEEVILRRRSSNKYNKKSWAQHGVDYGTGHRHFPDREKIRNEIASLDTLFKMIGCARVDVTGKSPEEEAKIILEIGAVVGNSLATVAKIRADQNVP